MPTKPPRAQLNIRCRDAQLAFWREAAELAGYGEFSQWVKDVLTREAVQSFRDFDRSRGKSADKRPDTPVE